MGELKSLAQSDLNSKAFGAYEGLCARRWRESI